MSITFLTMTVVTSLTYESRDLFKDRTMFTYVPGRAVIARLDGGIITDGELSDLAAKVGAVDHLHYDNMLDETTSIMIGVALWNWWKNNSFTKKAIAADKYKETLK
jgi:hypothetical protein